MAQRRLLTERFVKKISPPVSGERWIADSKLQGFGIRLWSTKSGGQKAFAIRIANKDGRSVRKTYDPSTGWAVNLHFAYSRAYRNRAPQLGDYLEDARAWAMTEIDRAKGRQTLDEENSKRAERTSVYVRRMTLGTAAQSMLNGMRANGLSQAYIDRVDKIFAHNIPRRLKDTPLGKLSPKVVAGLLARSKNPAGNIRILRSFLGQVLQRAAAFDGRLLAFSSNFSEEFLPRWRKNRDVRFPELRELSDDDYRRLLDAIDKQTGYWQQSLCLGLFFEFKAPLARVMAGEWRQIIEDYWYPYFPNEKTLWFESQEKITERAQALLDRTLFFVKRDFGKSRYWFPSSFSNRSEHIRTVETVWRHALQRCGIKYYPVREFARSYRDPNTPSYLISFLRQYGKTFREVRNAAQLSKTLHNRQFSSFNSDSYSKTRY